MLSTTYYTDNGDFELTIEADIEPADRSVGIMNDSLVDLVIVACTDTITKEVTQYDPPLEPQDSPWAGEADNMAEAIWEQASLEVDRREAEREDGNIFWDGL
jgi:hypothetical protein